MSLLDVELGPVVVFIMLWFSESLMLFHIHHLSPSFCFHVVWQLDKSRAKYLVPSWIFFFFKNSFENHCQCHKRQNCVIHKNVGARRKIEDQHFPKVLWFQVNVKSPIPLINLGFKTEDLPVSWVLLSRPQYFADHFSRNIDSDFRFSCFTFLYHTSTNPRAGPASSPGFSSLIHTHLP